MRWTLPLSVTRKTLGLQSGQLGFRSRQAPKGPPRPKAFLPDSIPGSLQRRQKLFRFLCSRLIIHGAVRTTYPRCKGIARGFYRYARWAKRNTPQARQAARRSLPDGALPLNILFNELGPRFKQLKGSYVKLYRTGFRNHDAAPMGIIQLRGSTRDYEYHLATMTVGRQLAIHSQGHDTAVARETAAAWRSAPLAEPILPCNGHDIHPAYRHLPRQTQLMMLKALGGASAADARDFDDLVRYQHDRTLAKARMSGAETAAELSRQEQDGQEFSVYDDLEPLMEGEEGFEAQEARRRAESKRAIEAGKLPASAPAVIEDVGAQLLPPRPAQAHLDDPRRRTTPKWARSAVQLTRGQRAAPRQLQRMPRYSNLTTRDPRAWRDVWRLGRDANRHHDGSNSSSVLAPRSV